MACSVALNRKPIPLRPVRRVEERRKVKTLAGLKRAIIDEIVQYQVQIEELERREAVVALELQAAWDTFEWLLEDRENQLRSLQCRLLGTLEELAALRGRSDQAAMACRRNLGRTRGAYKGLIAQHKQREGQLETLRTEINAWADERLDALSNLKAPRLKRNAELLALLDDVEAGIGVYGAHCPAMIRGATILMAPR